MTTDEALVKLGQSTTEAVCGVLEMFAPGQITPGEVAVVAPGKHPLEGIPVPAVATMVSYVDGVTGGNLFVMTVDGARKLAAAMMGMEPDETAGAAELSELELSAVAEAMNQMMASAAGATTAVLGTEVEIGVPETRTFTSADAAIDAYARTPHATRAAVSVCGEPCRLVQLVPNAFVVRMTRALDEAEYTAPDDRDRRSERRRPRTAPGTARRRWPASRCASAPSWDGPACPPPRSSGSRPARWWSSTGRPTSRSTCT